MFLDEDFFKLLEASKGYRIHLGNNVSSDTGVRLSEDLIEANDRNAIANGKVMWRVGEYVRNVTDTPQPIFKFELYPDLGRYQDCDSNRDFRSDYSLYSQYGKDMWVVIGDDDRFVQDFFGYPTVKDLSEIPENRRPSAIGTWDSKSLTKLMGKDWFSKKIIVRPVCSSCAGHPRGFNMPGSMLPYLLGGRTNAKGGWHPSIKANSYNNFPSLNCWKDTQPFGFGTIKLSIPWTAMYIEARFLGLLSKNNVLDAYNARLHPITTNSVLDLREFKSKGTPKQRDLKKLKEQFRQEFTEPPIVNVVERTDWQPRFTPRGRQERIVQTDA